MWIASFELCNSFGNGPTNFAPGWPAIWVKTLSAITIPGLVSLASMLTLAPGATT
jgi:hypothetical protein